MSSLVTKNGQIVYDGIHMEALIPDDYFKLRLAEEVDTGFFLFGNFVTYHYAADTKDRAHAVKASFELPFMFLTIPDTSSSETIDVGNGPERFRVLHYYKDSIVVVQNEVIQSPTNEEKFITLLFEGKLDNVAYDRIPAMHNMCKKYNNMHLRVPALYDEVMVAQTYGSKANPQQLARFTAKSHGTKVVGMTLREKSARINTFSSITFEDPIAMLTVADNAKRLNRREVPSDIEKIALGRE